MAIFTVRQEKTQVRGTQSFKVFFLSKSASLSHGYFGPSRKFTSASLPRLLLFCGTGQTYLLMLEQEHEALTFEKQELQGAIKQNSCLQRI